MPAVSVHRNKTSHVLNFNPHALVLWWLGSEKAEFSATPFSVLLLLLLKLDVAARSSTHFLFAFWRKAGEFTFAISKVASS